MKTLALLIALAAFAAVALGYIGGTDEGERTATVTSSESVQTWKSNSPESRISAKLEDGTEIAATSPHTPPPKPGERIMAAGQDACAVIARRARKRPRG